VIAAFLRQEAKSPIVWGALGMALLAWPLSLELSPLSRTLGSGSARSLAYDIAFLFAVVGAVYSDRKMASIGWLWGRASSARVDALFLVVVGLGAALPAACSLAPLMVFVGLDGVPALGYSILTCFHMASLLLLFRRMGFSLPERSVAIIVLALALPAALPGDAGFLSLPLRILDPLAGGSLGDVNALLTFHQLGSIFGLILLARTPRFKLAG